MTGKQLKNSILQWAIQGKLVPQDPNEEPASVLLEKIRAEKAQLIKEGKIKKDKNESIIFRGEDNSYYEKILATGEVKCIDEEIPFDIPAGWEWCRFSSLYLSLTDGTHSTPKYQDYGIPFISVKDMSSGKLNFNNTKYISQEEHNILTKRCNPQKGDLLLSKVGTTGIPLIIDTESDFSIFVSLALAKFSHDFVNPEYLIYLIQSPLVQNQASENTRGVGNKNWVLSAISNTLMVLPPYKEQCRIVNKIRILEPCLEKYTNSFLKLESLNNSINETLKKSVLQEAIQGRLVPQIAEEGTAQELLDQIQAEKQRLVKEGKLKKSALTSSVIYKGDDNKYYEQVGKEVFSIETEIPYDIPVGWHWSRLENVANLYTGNSISETEKLAKYTNVFGLDYIGTKDVGFNNLVDYDNGVSIPNEYINKFKIAKADSILLCIEGGSAGRKIAKIDRDVCFGNKLCCFDSYSRELSIYIYYYLQAPSFFENFKGNIAGIIGGVGVNTLKKLLIPLPPLKEQQRIVAQIDRLFEQLR